MMGFGRHGMMGALLAALAIDSSAKRERMDAELAEQREQIRAERKAAEIARKAAEQAKRDAESKQRAARAERRRLLAQRVYAALCNELSNAHVGQFKVTDLMDQQTINRFAAQVTSLVARELSKED